MKTKQQFYLLRVPFNPFISQGGLKAVVYTDVFQVFIMLMGVLTLLIRSAIQVGGWRTMWEAAERTDMIHFFE